MKCPKCGTPMRPSKKHPGYYLCDKCRKRYSGSSMKQNTSTKTASPRTRSTNHSCKTKKRKKRNLLPLLLFLIVFIGIGCFLYFSGILFPEDTSGNALEPQTTAIASDEKGSLSGLDIQILSTDINSGNKRIKPSQGNVFLFIEIEATNTTDKQLMIQDVANFKAVYQSEQVMPSPAPYNALPENATRLNGVIEANSSMTGYVCYELPKDFDSIDLEFSNPVWYNQKIKFTITQ